MFLFVHLGNDITLPSERIVAILGYGCLKQSFTDGDAVDDSALTEGATPKSAVITADKTYLSVISATTLTDRAKFVI